jgi:hypothetical protein
MPCAPATGVCTPAVLGHAQPCAEPACSAQQHMPCAPATWRLPRGCASCPAALVLYSAAVHGTARRMHGTCAEPHHMQQYIPHAETCTMQLHTWQLLHTPRMLPQQALAGPVVQPASARPSVALQCSCYGQPPQPLAGAVVRPASWPASCMPMAVCGTTRACCSLLGLAPAAPLASHRPPTHPPTLDSHTTAPFPAIPAGANHSLQQGYSRCCLHPQQPACVHVMAQSWPSHGPVMAQSWLSHGPINQQHACRHAPSMHYHPACYNSS